MTGPDGDVVPLRVRSALRPRRTEDPAITLARLGTVAQQLDELRRCAERVALDPQWSAMGWRATCAPLLVRLLGVRQLLASLSSIRVGHWPDTSWAAQVRTARGDIERRLFDVRVAMSALTSSESSDPDAVIALASDASLLASAAAELRVLITSHYPAVADGTE